MKLMVNVWGWGGKGADMFSKLQLRRQEYFLSSDAVKSFNNTTFSNKCFQKVLTVTSHLKSNKGEEQMSSQLISLYGLSLSQVGILKTSVSFH